MTAVGSLDTAPFSSQVISEPALVRPVRPGGHDLDQSIADLLIGHVGGGAGGLGDIAVRYGHQRGITSVMWVTVVFLIILVQVVQLIFNWLSRRIDKRLDQPSGAKKSGPLDLLARFAHTK